MSITEHWKPTWLDDGWERDYVQPKPQWVKVQGGSPLIYPGEFHLVYGRGGHGKTMFAIAAAAEMARSGLRTIFLDYEGTEDLTRYRLKAMGLDREQAARIAYQKMLDGVRSSDVEHVANWCQANEVQLIVVDSVARALAASGLDEVDNKGFAEFIQMLEPMRSGSQAVLLIDHVGHRREQRDADVVPTPRGASAKVDQVAVAIYFKQVKPWDEDNSGYAEMIGKKCRLGGFSEGDVVAVMQVQVVEGRISTSFHRRDRDPRFEGVGEPAVAEAIVELLEQGDQDGVEKMITTLASSTSRRAETCRVTLEQLVKKGIVEKVSQGSGKSTVIRLRQES